MFLPEGFRWKKGQPWKALAWYAFLCAGLPLAFRALYIDHPVLTESEMFYLAIVVMAVPTVIAVALSDVRRGIGRKLINASAGLFSFLYVSFFFNWAFNEAGVTDQVFGGFVIIFVGAAVYLYLAAGSGFCVEPAEMSPAATGGTAKD